LAAGLERKRVGFSGFWVKNKRKMGEWLAGGGWLGIMGAVRLLWKDIEKSEGNKQGVCQPLGVHRISGSDAREAVI